MSGTHQVGKSTLVTALGAALPNCQMVDEPYYEMAEAGHLFSDPPTTQDFEAQLVYSLHSVDETLGSVVFDRCPVDFLAYLIAESTYEGAELGDVVERVRESLRTLDLVVFVPVETPDRVAPDRLDDPSETRGTVDECLREILMADSLGLGLRAVEVRGSVEERVAQVLQDLDLDWSIMRNEGNT